MGINSKPIEQHCIRVGLPLVVVSFVLAVQTYAVVSSQGLTIHPYFAIHERHYGWTGVKGVRLVRSFKAPNGNIRRDRPYFIVEMTDGFSLNFHSSIFETPLADQGQLANFVAEHAHSHIEVEDPYS